MMRRLLAAFVIFLGAFLLFALEPFIAKSILPWFGGSAAVWSVCLVFYQVVLLAGYLYAHALKRPLLHIVLLAACLFLLPIGPGGFWRTASPDHPSWAILKMLTAVIGLPFIALSATGPLVQDWLAQAGEKLPYRFFAVSNFASLAALLAYPSIVEPNLDLRRQSLFWSIGFVLFAVLCSCLAWLLRSAVPPPTVAASKTPISIVFLWFSLSACGSMLLLSVTNQIDENVAAVPLLWVLPLAVYLISFILAFNRKTAYRRGVWLRLLAVGLGVIAYAAYDIRAVLPIQISIPVYLAGLFAACIFCQSELFRLRPDTSELKRFYLLIAAGGAAGAVFVGLLAPQLFGGIYELPLSLVCTAALAACLTWREGVWGVRALWTGMTVCMGVVWFLNWQQYAAGSLALRRNFYGSLRVTENDGLRKLFHGTVEHGAEFTDQARRQLATTYYGQDSGVGILLREWPAQTKKVAIVGLGAGTLATYANSGDSFRFFEINPNVISLARQYFYFLSGSKAAIEIVPGDARLSLEHEPDTKFDVIVLDAFSGDAIPVHLLTKQAMALYLSRLKPQGALAFHISNNYLDLAPVVQQLAADARYSCLIAQNSSNEENAVLASQWALVTLNADILANEALKMHAVENVRRYPVRLWTDSFSSLLPIIKIPSIRSGS